MRARSRYYSPVTWPRLWKPRRSSSPSFPSSLPGDAHADLPYLYALAEKIAARQDGFLVVVSQSTVPVCTDEEIEAIIRKFRSDAGFAVASNPEFPCKILHADVQQVTCGIGPDNWIGWNFLRDGPGYRNSSFPRDTVALASATANADAPAAQIQTAVKADDARKTAIAGRTIGVISPPLKPNTDDMRDEPSQGIVPALQGKGARVQTFDPKGQNAWQMLRDIDFKPSSYETCEGAKVLPILIKWDQFRMRALNRVKSLMKSPPVVDRATSTGSPKSASWASVISASVAQTCQPEGENLSAGTLKVTSLVNLAHDAVRPSNGRAAEQLTSCPLWPTNSASPDIVEFT